MFPTSLIQLAHYFRIFTLIVFCESIELFRLKYLYSLALSPLPRSITSLLLAPVVVPTLLEHNYALLFCDSPPLMSDTVLLGFAMIRVKSIFFRVCFPSLSLKSIIYLFILSDRVLVKVFPGKRRKDYFILFSNYFSYLFFLFLINFRQNALTDTFRA